MVLLWQVMRGCWTSHEDKLRLMESLCCNLEDVCSSEMLSDLREAVRAGCDDVLCLERKCCEIVNRLDVHRHILNTDELKQTLAADDNRFVVMVTTSTDNKSVVWVNSLTEST